MYRITTLRLPTRTLLSPSLRSLHSTTLRSASKPAHEPKSSQGHVTQKSKDPVHKDGDVQSAATRAGSDARSKAESSSSGEDEPFDAARQGSTGGEAKGKGGAKGPFKDQVGGQDEEHKPAGVKMGGSEEASGTLGENVKKALGSFDGLKQMRQDGRNFSTSARSLNGTTPRADAEGSRKPKHKDVQGDQNAHLKHTPGGSQGKPNTGNASPDPSLPSKQSSSSSSKPQSRSFSTSFPARADPNAPIAGSDVPRPGQKDAQTQAGLKTQPRGDDVQHGGSAGGGPSQGSKGAPESAPKPASGTAAPDPEISKSEKKTSTREGMGVRKFSTSSITRADPNSPIAGSDVPRPGQKDAQTQSGLRTQPRGSDVEHGGSAGGGPSQGSKGAPESAPKPASGTAAPDPEIPGSQKKNATREGMGVRKFSTSARIMATKPPGGYSKAIDPEPASAGYHVPPEGLPSNLKSPYQEVDPDAVQAAPSGAVPSSEIPYSSSAQDPPNEALRQAALDGTLAERNGQPTSEMGRQGLGEAWKHRK